MSENNSSSATQNEESENFEMVSIYRLTDAEQEELLLAQTECVFNWCTKDEWPMGVIMSYIWHEGRIWLTAGVHRHRVSAIKRNPKVSVVVTSKGTELGPFKTVTIKGTSVVHDDDDVKKWFYPQFSRKLYPVEAEAQAFEEKLNSALRIVIEVKPEKFISYNGHKMMAHSQGQLDASELAEPLESDTVRLQAELERRGMD